MKVFVILKSYTDAGGDNASSYGVFKTKDSAVSHLANVILDDFGYDNVEEFEDDYGVCFEDYFNTRRDSWTWDRDEDVIQFYIQEDELED